MAANVQAGLTPDPAPVEKKRTPPPPCQRRSGTV
jgi:hypothetical protein